METVTYYTGQCGCQMGSAIWELLCGEHGIAPDGQLVEDENKPDENDVSYQSFFYSAANGMYVPRCVFTDLECTVLDEIRLGYYRNLFHPNTLISGTEDAANIFSRGYWSLGSLKIINFKDMMRHQMECCDRCSSIISVHSCGGGTGSGYNALQQDELSEEYPKLAKLECVMFPSGLFSTNMVEPYNALMSAHYNMGITDITFTYDNDALYKVMDNNLKVSNPTYGDINRLTSQVFSAITASDRFGGTLRASLVDFQTNLVPYPRIHFPISSFSPICCRQILDHESKPIYNMARELFRNNMQFCSLDVEKGQYVSCCLLFRGCVSPSEVCYSMAKLKSDKLINFVDWCPTGMKVSLCGKPPVTVRNSKLAPNNINVALISNTSAIGEAFHSLLRKFNHLYHKRAFIHWYVGDGLEEGEFFDAKENIHVLIEDYNACYSSEGVLQDRGMYQKYNKRNKKTAEYTEEMQQYTTMMHRLEEIQEENAEAKPMNGEEEGAAAEEEAVVEAEVDAAADADVEALAEQNPEENEEAEEKQATEKNEESESLVASEAEVDDGELINDEDKDLSD